jgi:hypothetical protein
MQDLAQLRIGLAARAATNRHDAGHIVGQQAFA